MSPPRSYREGGGTASEVQGDTRAPESTLIRGELRTHSGALAVLVGLLISYAPPFIPFPEWIGGLIRAAIRTSSTRLLLYLLAPLAVLLLIALAIVAIVKRWERRPLSSIGIFRPRVSDLLLGIGAWILYEHLLQLVIFRVFAWGPGSAAGTVPSQRMMPKLPLAYQASSALLTGVSEEVCDRGYTIERLTVWLRSRWAAALCSLLLSLAAHVPDWGVRDLVFIAPGQFVLVGLYLATSRLLPCVIAHVAIDSYALWLADLLPLRLQAWIGGLYLLGVGM